MQWEFVVSKNYDDNNVVPLCELRGTRIEVLFKLGKLKFRKAESLSQLLVSLYNFHYLANCSNFTRFLVSLVRILSIRRIQSMILRSPFRRRSINENWVISKNHLKNYFYRDDLCKLYPSTRRVYQNFNTRRWLLDSQRRDTFKINRSRWSINWSINEFANFNSLDIYQNFTTQFSKRSALKMTITWHPKLCQNIFTHKFHVSTCKFS